MENDPKGDYTRDLVFTGENYSYWKDCMRVHINSVNRKIWKVIEDGCNMVGELTWLFCV